MCKYTYSDDVGRHGQQNVNKNNNAFDFKDKFAVTSPEERQNQVYFTYAWWAPNL